MYSYRDTKGKLWTSCSECERGGNGTDVDKCSAIWRVKRYNDLGCFIGTLMEKYRKQLDKGQ